MFRKLFGLAGVLCLLSVAAFSPCLAGSYQSIRLPNDSSAAPDPSFGPKFCSEHMLRGSYGTNITGVFLEPTSDPQVLVSKPLASVGILTFDGLGTVWGTDTNSFNGTVQVFSVTGSFFINDDCTGSLLVNLGGFVISNDIVVLDRGREVFLIQTTPGAVVTGVLKRL
ncbi:MAG TPA: hypothetical protein VLU25_03865 [Acidobacteriota bacterium]|nr:hypothetical protein [Acidobacteriota bacterium]